MLLKPGIKIYIEGKKRLMKMMFLSIIISLFTVACGVSGGSDPAPASTPPGPPNINLSSWFVSLSNTATGQNTDQTITVENTGSSQLELGQIAQTNPLAQPFSIVNDNCSGINLAPSETCTLQIRFSPTSEDSFEDAFDIPTNDPDDDHETVNVSGNGFLPGPPKISVSNIPVSFGNIVLEHFTEQTITIKNTGLSQLDLGQMAQTDPLAQPFSILNDSCSGTILAISATCTFQVRFSPTTQDSFADAFDIPSNDPDNDPVTVNVSGYGTGLNLSISQADLSNCSSGKISLFVTVSDKDEAPQTTLVQNDFITLLENGNDVLGTISNFSNNVLEPLSVVSIMDYSSSTIPVTSDIETAAKDFIDLLNTSEPDPANNDEASIIKFDDDVFLIQSFISDKTVLKNAVDAPFPGDPRSGSALFDSVARAIDEVALNASNNRHAIVVIADGHDDLTSVITLDETIAMALAQGIPVFSIGLGDVEIETLQRMGEETGGQFFLAPSSSDLQSIYTQIAAILGNLYVIEYTTTSSGGATVTLDVEVDFNGLQGIDSKDIPGC